MENMISISLNNHSLSINEGCSIEQLLQLQQYEKHKVAVAVNGDFVPRSRYAQTLLKAADEVDVLTAVQGG